MDGWAFIDASRRVPACEQTPILAILANYALREAAEELQARGVRAVLANPFDLDAVLRAVEQVIRHPAA